MTKLCPRGKAAAKRKFKVYPSAYANAYASRICAGKIKDPSGVKRKDFRGSKAGGGLMEATSRLKRQGLKEGTKFQDLVRGNLRDKAKTDAGTDNLKKFKKNVVMVSSGKRKGRIVPDTKDMEKKYGKENLKDLPGSFAKGGRAMLKGGGICKRGMNRQAIGKNS